MQWLVSLIVALLLCICLRAAAQQQIVDPDFQTTIEKPAYKSGGPTVAIDEAHDNFHTMSGQYSPLAALLRNDGYRVIASQVPFDTKDLAGIRVLVVANARDLKAILGGDISRPAFTIMNVTCLLSGFTPEDRCFLLRITLRTETRQTVSRGDSVSRWVRAGFSIGRRQAASQRNWIFRDRTDC
jgi:hypothetical protein